MDLEVNSFVKLTRLNLTSFWKQSVKIKVLNQPVIVLIL